MAAAAAAALIPSVAAASISSPARASGGSLARADLPAIPVPGALLAWGSRFGIGDGNDNRDDALTPVRTLPGDQRITQVQAGCSHAIALDASGKVLTWGANTSGQLGTGTAPGNGPQPVPAQVHFPAGVRIAAISAGSEFATALTTTGQVYAWGTDAEGELGDGGPRPFSSSPVLATLPAGSRVRFTAISSGSFFTLALTSQGRVYGWGSNQQGQLGFDPLVTTIGTSPVPVPGISVPVSAISAGGFHSLALTAGHTTVLAWGRDDVGQLGDGRAGQRFQPMPVKLNLGRGVRVRQISAGVLHSLALTTSQSVLAWGIGAMGQLGDGSTRIINVLPVVPQLPALTVAGRSVPVPVVSIGSGSVSDNSYAIIPALPRI